VSVTIPKVGREVHLVARPAGEPTKAEFALIDAPVAPPATDQARDPNGMTLGPVVRQNAPYPPA
jgi:hypothetical protein